MTLKQSIIRKKLTHFFFTSHDLLKEILEDLGLKKCYQTMKRKQ